MGMFKKVAKAVGKVAGNVAGGVGAKTAAKVASKVGGVLPKAIKETKVGKINPNLVGKPKPGVAPVGGKRSLPPMPTKVPATSKPLVSLPQRPTKPKLGPGVTRDTSKPLRG